MSLSDLEFMNDPEKWPHSFFLPMMQSVSGRPGFLFQPSIRMPCPPPEPKVYLATIWEIGSGPGKRAVKDIPYIEYKSLEAVIQDGWRID